MLWQSRLTLPKLHAMLKERAGIGSLFNNQYAHEIGSIGNLGNQSPREITDLPSKSTRQLMPEAGTDPANASPARIVNRARLESARFSRDEAIGRGMEAHEEGRSHHQAVQAG